MKVEIRRRVETREEIEIDLPYYYSYDCSGDDYNSDVFGKIEDGKCTTIHVTFSYRDGRETFELEIEKLPLGYIGDRADPKNKSTEAGFLEAKAKMLSAINET
jgi:hypothetical protein